MSATWNAILYLQIINGGCYSSVFLIESGRLEVKIVVEEMG